LCKEEIEILKIFSANNLSDRVSYPSKVARIASKMKKVWNSTKTDVILREVTKIVRMNEDAKIIIFSQVLMSS
jgi:hypothetical protein